jgi:glyoxylase-like metal-dependent hydrolase (beta-lactamase superfamily II)
MTTANSSTEPSQAARLEASHDMDPVAGTVDVDIPIDQLWECFRQANLWGRWNPCFFWAMNRDLVLNKQLIWVFQPIQWWYLYKMPAIAKIIEVEPQRKVTWEVSALPGFFAHHTYHMEDLGSGRTRFGSWEKATGWSFRLMKGFWMSHFTFVKDRSLEGAKALEQIYREQGSLSKQTISPRNYGGFWLALVLAIALIIGGLFGGWLYTSFVRQTAVALAPGIHAILGGGGNSLVVESNNHALLVDTKFPPGSNSLKKWIDHNVDAPITQVVNTHYHYDHTEGNILYPEAQIIAYKTVPQLMQQRDPSVWHEHPTGIPNQVIDDTTTITIGKQDIILIHPGVAHTHGDLIAYLPEPNIVATGDLLFHTYYPFMDLGKGGISIPGTVQALRQLAEQYPTAVFMPGHGPIAQAQDLRYHADYLEFLYNAVEKAYKRGLSADDTVKQVDLSDWQKKILPSFHGGQLEWATAHHNIRWVYQLLQHPIS